MGRVHRSSVDEIKDVAANTCLEAVSSPKSLSKTAVPPLVVMVLMPGVPVWKVGWRGAPSSAPALVESV